jgi:hypothetical protein
MDLELFLNELIYPLEVVTITLMAVVTARKAVQDKQQRGVMNWIRMIVFGVFACFAIQSWLGFMNATLNLGLPEFFQTMRDSYLTLGGIAIGGIVTLGIILVTYSNRWESLYFAPAFAYAGLLILIVSTGLTGLHQPYIEYGALIGLGFMYLTAFRIKDNSALGIAIFFTLAFSTIVLEIPLIPALINLGYLVFGLIFTLGYFRVFKPTPEVPPE